MKILTYICVLAVLAMSACNKKDAIENKVGIHLDPVSNLALQQLTAPEVKLTWTNPGNIPAEIQQPLRIYIEVREITGVMQTLPSLTTTLENAPTEFTWTLPDPSKKYLFTVKVNGTANVTDPRFATNIFSSGQTVSYN